MFDRMMIKAGPTAQFKYFFFTETCLELMRWPAAEMRFHILEIDKEKIIFGGYQFFQSFRED